MKREKRLINSVCAVITTNHNLEQNNENVITDLAEHRSPPDPPGAAPLHTTSAGGKTGTDTEETRA